MSHRRTVKVYFPLYFADAVAKGRKALRLGVRAAAKSAGVSPSTLSRAELGHMPDVRTLIKLSIWAGAK